MPSTKRCSGADLLLSLPLVLFAVGCTSEKVVFRDRAPFNEPVAAAQGFLGYFTAETKQTTCGNCHADIQADWVETAHADAWAALPANAASTCKDCHTVGEKGNAVTGPAGYAANEGARVRERAYLVETAADLAPRISSQLEFHELEGPAGPAICEAATALDVDLVVLASHGRGAMGRFWLGGVADYVIRQLGVPVLLVRPGRSEQATPPALHSILVALDLSTDAEAILEPVIALAQLVNGHVTLVHVVEPVLGYSDPLAPYPVSYADVLETGRKQAQHRLDAVADRLRLRGLGVATRVDTALNAAGGLLQALETGNYDVLAMTTHGRSGLGRLLLGSVADKVIRGASKPVLLVRPTPAG